MRAHRCFPLNGTIESGHQSRIAQLTEQVARLAPQEVSTPSSNELQDLVATLRAQLDRQSTMMSEAAAKYTQMELQLTSLQAVASQNQVPAETAPAPAATPQLATAQVQGSQSSANSRPR